jgi:hypothetical protein
MDIFLGIMLAGFGLFLLFMVVALLPLSSEWFDMIFGKSDKDIEKFVDGLTDED